MKTIQFTKLSSRELEVLELISFGNSSRDIAQELYLSTETIRTYRKKIISKMNARNAADLIRLAFQHELISV